MSRTLAAAAATFLLLLTGCSSDSGDSADAGDPSGSGGSTSASADVHQVSGAGLTFEVPDSLQEVDADKVADDTADDETVADVAEQMGMSTDQFNQYMKQVDLFLFDSESTGGFSTNVNVIPFPVPLPENSALQQQLEQVGATIVDTGETTTDAGDVTTISYSLDMAGQSVEGQGIFVDLGDSSASITVSSSDRDTADEIADGIVASLDQE
ncbi:hypothetical protein [Nocardioides taihuensis]|uniref:Prokaryotic membrane lipoprotein lipid attachment site profile n=1 Tax=Nocardioides taihuensis TaxID=1835606 RepID=A0ABW0BK22_9ACTN